MLANFGIAVLLAAATGLGYLAVKHPRVYRKVGWVILLVWGFFWTLVSAYAVGMLNAMIAIAPVVGDKMDAVRAAVDAAQPSLTWTTVLSVGGAAFIIVLRIIAELVIEEADASSGQQQSRRKKTD